LNVHRVSDIRQIEIHISKPFVPYPSSFEVEIAIAKLKSFKSGSDQIQAETGGEILSSKIHKLIKSIWNKEELPDQYSSLKVKSIHR
jgi:hypothetical protein